MAADVAKKRPGEAVGCIREKEGPDGCGTAPHCATCGAVHAILESQKEGKKVVRECRILVESGEGVAPMDLKVTATPFTAGDDRFIMAAIEDISQPKRLAVLQRTFFHDVLNTASCILGCADCLASEDTEAPENCEEIADLTGQLVETIQAQRDLDQAEAGDLKLHFSKRFTFPPSWMLCDWNTVSIPLPKGAPSSLATHGKVWSLRIAAFFNGFWRTCSRMPWKPPLQATR